MVHTKYSILIIVCCISLISLSQNSKQSVGIQVYDSSKVFSSLKLNGSFDQLIDSPVSWIYNLDRGNYRFQKCCVDTTLIIDESLKSSDTTLQLKTKKESFTLTIDNSTAYSEWKLFSSKSNLRGVYFFGSDHQLLNEKFFDEKNNLILSVMYPNDKDKRVEEWYYGGKILKTIFNTGQGVLILMNHTNQNKAWEVRYNFYGELISATYYDESGNYVRRIMGRKSSSGR